ncbi:ribosome maturation factor RimP [Halopolyspora algeriensis]|uniref:Ribosome maturation factor RimP n=1 Tax=Halopolyspora algeriensis TaxID=1500506 RepID=A0A368VGI8_9ACTN|nr:ribosome maturation factor RimP [Halopolyspora algeriensis]RCW39763.1 ribosome maturation factor RimP [Halopolyspora algeriensis]TQM56418.1 ribosome maturation factor RimP [Halopolyspora algeriensis]
MSSPPRNEVVARLEPTVADTVATLGFDLEELDVQQAGRRRLVKVVIDADDGVGLDDITDVSHAVSDVLDTHEHVLAGSYTLEVTSPGVDRPLTKVRHWRRARNRLAKLRLTDGSELTARVGDAEDGTVVVLAGGRIRQLAYRDIEHAVVEVEFQQPPAKELAELDRAADAVGRHDDDGEDTEDSR